MKGMTLQKITDLSETDQPLILEDLPKPIPGPDDVLIRVVVCGVCHTELDEIEGRTSPPELPVVPGHEVVGVVIKTGKNVTEVKKGDRVGVAWIHSACGNCEHCIAGNENLCEKFTATGRDVNGGYAEYLTAPASFVHLIPDSISDEHAAPMMCAGAIGYRSLMLTEIENGDHLGLTGFGASGHLVLKLSRYLYPDTDIYVFARSENQRKFAVKLGAVWAGDTEEDSPQKLHAIIDTTPVWKPVVEALKNLRASGRLVINAIRKEDFDKDYLLNIDYTKHLWSEKEIKSVANVTRRDVSEFLNVAAKIPIKPDVTIFPLEDANNALKQIKRGGGKGASVLKLSNNFSPVPRTR